MSYRKAVLLNLVGFIGFLIAFVITTFIAAQLNTNCGPFGRFLCGDAVQRIGFPFVFLEIGGGPSRSGIPLPENSLLAFSADVGIALLGSVIAGATCQYRFGRASTAGQSILNSKTFWR